MSDPVLLPAPRTSSFGFERVAAGEPRVASTAGLPAQGYRLRVTNEGIDIDAADAAGEFYARKTLAQLAAGGDVPVCEIQDWPDIAIRGVMLDISRDKVPTMATLCELVDRLAGWKVNELQLYTEHTFAYAGHEEVWQDASPMTPDEIADLDTYCADRHVTLTPNQNCLGHMERWLRHPTYRDLGLVSEPFTLGGIMRRPPMTMDPADPRVMALARELFGQLLPNFTRSSRVNVGLDEPFELAEERYDDYVDYLTALRAAPELGGREMLVWGDILATHPQLIDRLPDGVTVAEWGYEANHPFDERVAALEKAGRERWVCPGTSAWNTLFGRTANMRENQFAAAAAARAYGTSGWLNTDWGDGGHLQYLPASYAGFAHGAAVAWCADANAEIDFDAIDALTGAYALAGRTYAYSERQTPNMAAYLLPLWLPQLRRSFVTNDEFDRIEADLDAAASATADAELHNSIALARVLVDDGRGRNDGDGTLAGIAEPTRRALTEQLDVVIAAHRELWLARNRPGGLSDSVSWLERLRDSYIAGTVDDTWLPPGLRAV